MSPHRGTGISILQLSCLSLLPITEAFQLSNPSFTFPGDSLAISWTSSPDDPKDFDLKVGFCGGVDSDGAFLFQQQGIDAQASSSRFASITKVLPVALGLPAACFVRASDSETGDILDSSPVQLIAANSITTLSTKSTPSSQTTKTTKHVITTNVPLTTLSRSSPVTTVSTTHTTLTLAQSHVHTPSSSTDTSLSSPSTSLPLRSTVLPSTSTPLPPSVSTAPKVVLSTTSNFTTTTISTDTPTHSSVRSKDDKRSAGPLVGEVLGIVFAVLLLFVFIAWWIWSRRLRRRRQLRSEPFVPDKGYLQPISKQEEFENERGARTGNTRNLRSSQQPVVPPATDQKVDLERGDSVGSLGPETGTGARVGTNGTGMGTGSARVEEEVTMLRERLMALEDQHRELTGELRSAVIIPPQYSQ